MQNEQNVNAPVLISPDTSFIGTLWDDPSNISTEDNRRRQECLSLIKIPEIYLDEDARLLAISPFVMSEIRQRDYFPARQKGINAIMNFSVILPPPTTEIIPHCEDIIETAKDIKIYHEDEYVDYLILAHVKHLNMPFATDDRTMARVAKQSGIKTYCFLKGIEENYKQDAKTIIRLQLKQD